TLAEILGRGSPLGKLILAEPPIERYDDDSHNFVAPVRMSMVEVGAAHSATPMGRSAHVDQYVRDHLPPVADWPRLDFAGLAYPPQLNVAAELLDRHVREGRGDRAAVWFEGRPTTFAELLAWANRWARVLSEDLRVVPGNRVLLRGFNTPS